MRGLMTSVCILLLASPCAGQFDYPDFTDSSDIILVGDATAPSERLHLTPSAAYQVGAAWHSEPQAVTPGFSTTLTFQLTELGGGAGYAADGLALVIQNDSSTAIGGFGKGLGYGCAEGGQTGIPNSIAIEIDTFPNAALGEPTTAHVSIQTRGLLENDPDHAFSLGSTTNLPNLRDEQVHLLRVSYNSGVMSVFVDDLTSPLLEAAVDLSSMLSLAGGEKAWIGLTAGTGTAWQRHEITSWAYMSIPDPLGDLNCDGWVNNGDIDPFVMAITYPGYYTALFPDCDITLADCNGDGVVNNGDIDAFVSLLGG